MATTTKITGSSSANKFGFYADVVVGDLDNNTQTFPVTVNVYLVNNGVRTDSNNWTKYIELSGIASDTKTAQNVKTNDVAMNGGIKLINTALFNVPVSYQSIVVTAYIEKSSYTQYDPGRCYLSGIVSMPKVASTWNSTLLSLANVENEFELPINQYVAEYTNKVTITNLNMATVVKEINNAINGQKVKFSQQELNTIYTMENNKTLNPVRFYMNLYTYDRDGNQIGSTQRLACDGGLVGAEPLVTYTITEEDENVSNFLGGKQTEFVVKDASNLKFEIIPTALKGATITSVKVNNSNATLQENVYKITLNDVQTGTFNIVITDSRNLTKTYPINKQLLNYVSTKINSWDFDRETTTSSNLILNADITCYSGSLNSIMNIPTVRYSLNNNDWIEINNFTFSNNKIVLNKVLLEDVLDYQEAGTLYLEVYDLLTEDKQNNKIKVGVYTIGYGERVVRINGDLEIADRNGQNKINILNEIKRLGFNLTELYSGNDGVTNVGSSKTISLSKSIQDFDLIIAITRGDYNHYRTTIFLPILSSIVQEISVRANDNYYSNGYLMITNNTTMELTLESSAGWNYMYFSKVYGIKIKN